MTNVNLIQVSGDTIEECLDAIRNELANEKCTRCGFGQDAANPNKLTADGAAKDRGDEVLTLRRDLLDLRRKILRKEPHRALLKDIDWTLDNLENWLSEN